MPKQHSRGKLTETSDIQIDLNTGIKELDQEGTYKYLGVNEGDRIQLMPP